MKVTIQTESEIEITFPYFTGTPLHSTCWISEREAISVEHTDTECSIANICYTSNTPYAYRLTEPTILSIEFNSWLVKAFDKLYTLVISEQEYKEEYEQERRDEMKEREQLFNEERDHEKDNMDAIREAFKK